MICSGIFLITVLVPRRSVVNAILEERRDADAASSQLLAPRLLRGTVISRGLRNSACVMA